MIKGINVWSFPASMSFKDCLGLASAAGFESIEPALDEKGPLTPESTADDISEIRKAVAQAGLKISSLATGLYWKYSFTSNDPAKREKASYIAKKQIDMAVLLGTDAILVVPGAVGVDFIPGSEVVEYDIAYERSLSALIPISEYVAQRGVLLCVENVWNKFLLSPLEMRDFIDKLSPIGAGAYFDVGNVIYSGYPEHWIKILGSRIKRIHFKDFRRNSCGIEGFVDLLSGSVSYTAVMAGLSGAGYDGYVTAEVSPYKQYPEQKIYNTSAAMDRILGRERDQQQG